MISFKSKHFPKDIILMAIRWYCTYALSYREMDETYLKVKGRWCYQYRAVDKFGKTVDFLLSKKRDKKSARPFFKKAIKFNGMPVKVNLDKNPAYTAGLEEINRGLKANEQIIIRRVKYLNNMVEQGHLFIKKITRPMKGFKFFHSAPATLKGIELCHMLRKRQFKNYSKVLNFEVFYQLAA